MIQVVSGIESGTESRLEEFRARPKNATSLDEWANGGRMNEVRSDALVFFFGATGDLAYKRSFRRCTRWLDAVTWVFPWSVWQSPIGTSRTFVPGRARAFRRMAGFILSLSIGSVGFCGSWMVSTPIPPLLQPFEWNWSSRAPGSLPGYSSGAIRDRCAPVGGARLCGDALSSQRVGADIAGDSTNQ
jgi:hypothetical protein